MNGSKYILTFTAGLLVAGIPIVVALGSKPSYAEMHRRVSETVDDKLKPVEVRLKGLEASQAKLEKSLNQQVEIYTSMDKKQAVLVDQVSRLVHLIEDTRRKDD